MAARMAPTGAPGHHASRAKRAPWYRPAPRHEEKGDFMTWQTPTATDFRFGFEITMYVAAR